MYTAFNSRHTHTNPPFPTAMNNRTLQQHVESQDSRPIRMNPNGQYNLNFVDWNNEWERAYEAMEADGKQLQLIP